MSVYLWMLDKNILEWSKKAYTKTSELFVRLCAGSSPANSSGFHQENRWVERETRRLYYISDSIWQCNNAATRGSKKERAASGFSYIHFLHSAHTFSYRDGRTGPSLLVESDCLRCQGDAVENIKPRLYTINQWAVEHYYIIISSSSERHMRDDDDDDGQWSPWVEPPQTSFHHPFFSDVYHVPDICQFP